MFVQKLARLVRQWQWSETQSRQVAVPSFTQRLEASPGTFEEWRRRLCEEDRLYGRPSSAGLARLREVTAEEVQSTLEVARRILAHEFDLLGSGPFRPRDRSRLGKYATYEPIDWFLDPVSGLHFPGDVPHREWNTATLSPQGADIKLPWELARCQHWLPLAQAYRLTGDERFAREIAHQLRDFTDANPVGFGIHWTCTMDVSLRAVSWALALDAIRNLEGLSDSLWKHAYDSLFAHGAFIFDNLENKYEVTSNHFLSNIVALFYLGSVFRDLPEGTFWYEFSRSTLEKEMEVQVLDDGADFESSTAYHRLVTELFLGAARIAQKRQAPFSDAYRRKLRQMVTYLLATVRPDGLLPQVGDTDNGRLHLLTDYGGARPLDGLHLLAPAALVLSEPSWLLYVGSRGLWEAAWWGFDVERIETASQPLPPVGELFPRAGVFVARNEGSYLLVTNGVVGTRGFGNHKHNDQLSLEYHSDGVPVVVDPGSYGYTRDADARNLFRSTGYHNTLSIDGMEQNEIRPEWLFRMFEAAHPQHGSCISTEEAAEYRGRHSAYRRLSEPVLHERRLHLHVRTGRLVLLDILEGSGSHRLCWHFHLDPQVDVLDLEQGRYLLSCQGRRFRFEASDRIPGRIVEVGYSPSYGVRVPSRALEFELTVSLDEKRAWGFVIAPERHFDLGEAQRELARLGADRGFAESPGGSG